MHPCSKTSESNEWRLQLEKHHIAVVVKDTVSMMLPTCLTANTTFSKPNLDIILVFWWKTSLVLRLLWLWASPCGKLILPTLDLGLWWVWAFGGSCVVVKHANPFTVRYQQEKRKHSAASNRITIPNTSKLVYEGIKRASVKLLTYTSLWIMRQSIVSAWKPTSLNKLYQWREVVSYSARITPQASR